MEQVKRFASDWELTIDPEFRDLLHKQSPSEAELFKYSMLKDGCREAVIVWKHDGKKIIVDGHHRYNFCLEHDMQFAVAEMEFADRDAVKEWIILNQLARRNLPMHEHARLALAYKPIIEAKTSQGARTDLSANSPKSYIDTRKELAKLAGVSENTITKVEHIEAEAPQPIVDAARAGEITVNAAYNVTKLDEETREGIAKRIEGGEAPKKVVRDALGIKQKNITRWTKEDRENRAKTLEILDQMRNGEPPEYTVDMLVEDIQINSTAYFDMLNAILEQHNELINADNRPQIGKAIEKYVIDVANELRRKIA